MAKIETLKCERGNHEWSRTSARGPKPRMCPDKTCGGTATGIDLTRVPAESDATRTEAETVPTVSASAVAERIDNLTARMATLKRLDAERLRKHREGVSA